MGTQVWLLCSPAMRLPILSLTIPVLALCPLAGAAQSSGPIHQFFGVEFQDRLGTAVAEAGDVDGDGVVDLIVGAKWSSRSGFSTAGRAVVYSGRTGAVLHEFLGIDAEDRLGIAVAPAGDIDQDGADDFYVGAEQENSATLNGCGAVHLYSGATGTVIRTLYGSSHFDRFGSAIADMDDIDGDGFRDVLIGARTARETGLSQAGSIYLYSGATGQLLQQFDGPDSFMHLGGSVANAGDVDGDGVHDLLAGALATTNGGLSYAGSAFVVSGATGLQIHRIDGAFAGGQLGEAVTGIGDLNQDGYADFLVGEPRANPHGLNGAGSAWVFSGLDGSVLARHDGTEADARVGKTATSLGDVDADGVEDYTVGQGSIGGPADAAVTYSGATAVEIYRVEDCRGGNLASSLGHCSDLNGDGVRELMLGAQDEHDEHFQGGAVYVMSGATGGYTLPLLGITGSCPNPVTVNVECLTPNGVVALVYGVAGNFTVPNGPCAGLELAIANPTIEGTYVADAFGMFSLTTGTLPPAACGITVQAVDVTRCLASLPVTL